MPRVLVVDSAESWNFYENQAKIQSCPIVAYFTASWYVPSPYINAFFEDLALSNMDALFLIVYADQVQEVASRLKVNSMPTFMFLKDGNEMAKVVGANLDEIKKMVDDSFGQSSRVVNVA